MDEACSSAVRVFEERSGLSLIRSTKPFVSVSSSTEPISAVPSEAPRFWAVPWSPPASFASDGATADMITFPSWDMSSPAPNPKPTSARANVAPSSVTSIVPSRTNAETAIRTSPTWTTMRGAIRAENLGPRRAATSNAIESGNSRLPVSNAS